MEKPKVKSEINKVYRYITAIGVIFFGIFGYFITIASINTNSVEMAGVLISLVFWGFAIWSFIGFWIYYPDIRIYSDRLEISNYLGLYKKIILFSEISSIDTINKKNEKISWEECEIRTTDNKKYRIYETSYDNYTLIKIGLEKKKIRENHNRPVLIKKEKRAEKIIFLSFIIVSLYGMYYFYDKSRNYKIDDNSLIEVELTLDKKPEIIKGSKSSSLIMSIKEFPTFEFGIYGVAFKTSKRVEFVENTEGGEKIVLTFEKDEYEQKLTKTAELTFWNKYFSYSEIKVYGIKSQKMVFLDTESYVEETKSDSKWGYWGLLVVLIYFLYSTRKETMKLLRK
jgi:hypothetical protein